jgi:penicillin-insensitive murein endopeptidase
MKALFLVLTLGLAAAGAQADSTNLSSSVTPTRSASLYALWGKIEQPLSGKPDPIGVYGAGCIAGAEALPLDGPGYSVMHPSRLRYFGHPVLLQFLKNLGEEMHARKLPRVLIGDMGRPRGGPMISGHASHQIGLDVDIWYRMSKKKPSAKEREAWGSPQLVRKNRRVTPGWTNAQRQLVELAASAPEVERVFVNPAIKQDLCRKFPDAPWLYKVRAWWGHADHVHARLYCPKESPDCRPQEPLDPKEKQCGAELAWWFSKEAEDKGKEKSKEIAERNFPELPHQCERMTEDPMIAQHKE